MFSTNTSHHRRSSHGAMPTYTSGRNEFRSSANTTSRDFLSPEDALRRPRTNSLSYPRSRPRTVSFGQPPQSIMPLHAPMPQPPRYPTYMTHAPHVPFPQPAPVQVVRVPVPVPVPVPSGDRYGYRHSVHHPPVPLPATSAQYGAYERRPMMRRSSSWAHLRRDEPRREYEHHKRQVGVGMPFAR